MSEKQKLNRILSITGWSRDHLADLLDVSNMTLMRWMKGRSRPQEEYRARIDEMYDGVVAPLLCEIDRLADAVEKKILKEKITALSKNDCEV